MQYYTFKLDEESRNLCNIINPFGKYKHTCLSMDFICSPDIAQAEIDNILSVIHATDLYVDDVGAFSISWDHHVELLSTMLHHLNDNGLPSAHLSVNGLSKKWTALDVFSLHVALKIDAIVHMDHPRTSSDPHQFISCFNYYHNMIPRWAHVLKPLTSCSSMKKNHSLDR